jgi:hypothetical protein
LQIFFKICFSLVLGMVYFLNVWQLLLVELSWVFHQVETLLAILNIYIPTPCIL